MPHKTILLNGLIEADISEASLMFDVAPASTDPEPKQVELILKGKSIAVVRDSDHETSSIVIFHPSATTRRQVKDYEGWDVAIVLDDKNGKFTPNTPQRILRSVYEAGNDTLIVQTENQ